VFDNALATATQIIGSEQLFRMGLAADLLGDLAYAGLTVLLYLILRASSSGVAVGQLCFGLAGSVVLAANLPNMLAPLILLKRLAPLGGMPQSSLDLLALGWTKLYSAGYLIALAFFAVQVFLIGRLIVRARLFPRIFGWLFMIEGVCNAAFVFTSLLAPAIADRVSTYALLPGLPAEAGFALWLLFAPSKGRPSPSGLRQPQMSAP
jgi:hypothetical protein